MEQQEERYTAPWWETPFGAWVRDYGTGRLRRELEVTKSAVHGWVRGVIRPRPKKIERILALAKGRLSSADITSQPALVAKLTQS